MDIYEQIHTHITAVPHLQEWPDLLSIVQRSVARRPENWQLPGVACRAVGGQTEQAIRVMAALACLQISIILVDDLLDEDPQGEQQRLGTPAVANAAAAFQAAGLTLIRDSDYPPASQLALLTCLNDMAATTAYGQYLDTLGVENEAAYWQQVQLKSAPFFGAAFQVGALAGGADQTTAGQLRQLGLLYGRIIQVQDDLKDVMAQPAGPDWLPGRSPLPILFAERVQHPDQERFQQLRERVSEPAALVEAQEILLRCGAVSYCIHHIVNGYHEAQQLVGGMQLAENAGFLALFDELLAPVQELFMAVGQEAPRFRPDSQG